MKVELRDNILIATREPGEKLRFRRGGRGGSAESQLLHRVKLELQAQGYDVLKKRMHKDGHVVAPEVQYVRDRKGTFCVFNLFYARNDAGKLFNTDGKVSLQVVRFEPDMKTLTATVGGITCDGGVVRDGSWATDVAVDAC